MNTFKVDLLIYSNKYLWKSRDPTSTLSSLELEQIRDYNNFELISKTSHHHTSIFNLSTLLRFFEFTRCAIIRTRQNSQQIFHTKTNHNWITMYTLTQQILKKNSEAKLCYQQINNSPIVSRAHQLFQINTREYENHAAAESADKSRHNQQFECFPER